VKKELIIRGGGLITPLGANLPETWEAIVRGDCIVDHSRSPLRSVTHSSKVSALAIAAAREAITDADWSDEVVRSDQTALVVGTSKGPIDEWLTAPPPDFTSTSDNQPNPFFTGIGLHTVAVDLATDLTLACGPRLTVSSACATGLLAVIRAAMLLEQGQAGRAIVVACESSLHPLLLQSYQRLGVVARKGDRIRPMDRHRTGFFVSEAAAAICLEYGMPEAGDIVVDRYAFGSDATHLTGVDPAGRTLRRCLANCGIGEALDLIHTHGTATILNDPIELAAIDEGLTGDRAVHLYSHKAAIGHSMGAAGLISIVLNRLMHRRGLVLPNTNTLAALPARSCVMSSSAISRTVQRSLCAAAGFGGSTAVIRLKTAV
jgi:3-oxoacyl-(acyl-carrier-protein) synthase